MDRNVDPDSDNLTDDVALRKESVDRNGISGVDTVSHQHVALRKESVDRNNVAKCKKTIKQVALRKESVDRNIWPVAYDATGHTVALRKESVDRNWNLVDQAPEHRGRSP